MAQINPYRSPKNRESAEAMSDERLLWLWAVSSIIASVLSIVLFGLYGHWHWHDGPWELTIPGQLGLSWLVAVDGSKAISTLLAVVSLMLTVLTFAGRGHSQGLASLPTCLAALTTAPVAM